MTNEEKSKIIELIREGKKNFTEIGNEVGYCPSSISKFARTHGYSRGTGYLPPNKVDKNRARELRREGKTYKEIADIYGVSIVMIRKIVKDNYERQNN